MRNSKRKRNRRWVTSWGDAIINGRNAYGVYEQLKLRNIRVSRAWLDELAKIDPAVFDALKGTKP